MQNATATASQCNGLLTSKKSRVNILFDTLFNNKDKTRFFIKSPAVVRRKLGWMISHGQKNLQVISDFDWTLSKYLKDNGQTNPTCHGIFEHDSQISDEARRKLRMLKQTYGSLEFDSNIPHFLKIPYMLEWWDISHRVIASCNIHRDELKAIVYNSNLELRDKVPDFLSTLNNHDIPMVVFSAGLGNIIKTILEKEGVLYENVKVASNFMNFNNEGLLVGFQSPCIHTFNKSFGSLALNDEDRNMFSKRRCVLLLGDSLYDQHMADGLLVEEIRENIKETDTSVVLKIGFLNGKIETLLDEYMRIYDIVLTRDGTFGLPLEIVNCVVESKQTNCAGEYLEKAT